MDINERSMGTVTVIDLHGKLISEAAQRFKDKMNSLVFQGRTQIVLNPGDVSQIDSTGLGEIVACLTTVTRRGGNIKLSNVAKRNQDLLSITSSALDIRTEPLTGSRCLLARSARPARYAYKIHVRARITR